MTTKREVDRAYAKATETGELACKAAIEATARPGDVLARAALKKAQRLARLAERAAEERENELHKGKR